MEQIIFVDKPSGMTSFGVVARMRRVLGEAEGGKVKVGHTGTLDPFATGLMILMAGKATRRAMEYSKLDKVYEATIRLGATSSTGDPEGEIREILSGEPFGGAPIFMGQRPRSRAGSRGVHASLPQSPENNSRISPPDAGQIKGVLKGFVGEIWQVPPVFSAIKINGERAYRLARKGKEVEMPGRQVTVYALELVSYEWPVLRIRTHVSSGTYIRSLAEDIGKALGTGAYVTSLRRTRVGQYDISEVPLMDVPK